MPPGLVGKRVILLGARPGALSSVDSLLATGLVSLFCCLLSVRHV